MLRSNLYSGIAKFSDLAAEMFYVDNHSRPHNVNRFVPENTGRKKIEREFALFVNDGVSGVVAALITDYHVVLFRKKVNHSALSFVAPVDTNDCSKHFCFSYVY